MLAASGVRCGEFTGGKPFLRNMAGSSCLFDETSSGVELNPKDEDAVADMLLAGVETAKKHNISICSSTSIEEWMQEGASPKKGEHYEAAIEQNVKLHSRVFSEGGIANSCIREWHIEFLRSIEFETFTNLQKACDIVNAMDEGV